MRQAELSELRETLEATCNAFARENGMRESEVRAAMLRPPGLAEHKTYILQQWNRTESYAEVHRLLKGRGVSVSRQGVRQAIQRWGG